MISISVFEIPSATIQRRQGGLRKLFIRTKGV